MRKILVFFKKHPLTTSLFLSILGCALWTYWLDPLCRKFFTFISTMINIVFTSFLDQTYRQISYGPNDTNTILTMQLCYYICFIPIIMLESKIFFFHKNKQKEKMNNNDTPVESPKKIQISFKAKAIFANIILILIIAYQIGSASFINSCQTITLCNIEILAPHISDQEYKELKSSFYSISTKNDYDNLQTVINNIATANGLTLKK